MDERLKNTIDDWKRYLKSKSLCESVDSDIAFRRAMRKLDSFIATQVPSTKGMIWRNGQVNPNASIADVNAALNLLSKFGQATLDDLGDPSDPDRLSGTPMNSMFISQEDSKSDEWNPGNSQNQGAEGGTNPLKLPSSGKMDSSKSPIKQLQNANVDERMEALMNLIENVKK